TQARWDHGHSALPGHVGHGVRHRCTTEDYARVKAVDDAAGIGGARRNPRTACRAHECRAGLGQQGHGDLYLGNVTLVAPGHVLSCHEYVTARTYHEHTSQ